MGYIYKIENMINHKAYVGQTKRSIIERWKEHLIDSETKNYSLYRAIRKYGKNNFNLSLLEECDNDKLDERERYWIKQLNSYGETGYNMTEGGQGFSKGLDYDQICETYILTKSLEETAAIHNCATTTVRNALHFNGIERFPTPKTAKCVEMIDPNTNQVILTFSSICEAGRYKEEWQSSTINAAVLGRKNSAYGYYWREKGDNNKEFQPLFRNKRKIGQFDKQGNKINEFNSIAEANRSLGKKSNHSGISNVLKGKAKTALGYIWYYLD